MLVPLVEQSAIGILSLLAQQMGGGVITDKDGEAPVAALLTERQIACLQGVAQHKTAKEIAVELGISNHAVEKHLKVVRRKLGAETTLEALRIFQRGTVEPHYAPSDLCMGTEALHPMSHGRLDDVASGHFQVRPKRFWENDLELTARQVLVAIALVAIGLVATVALLIAAAQGFNSVLSNS